MMRYWGMILIMLFNLVWVIVSVITSIDLTLVGHIRGWKRLHYPKWFGGFIDKTRKGYEMLKDWTTHPKVLAMLFACLGLLGGSVALTVCVWLSVNDIEIGLLWLIVAALYVPTIAWLVFSKVKTGKEYRRYISDKTHQKQE